jgi:hypothetical protein
MDEECVVLDAEYGKDRPGDHSHPTPVECS